MSLNPIRFVKKITAALLFGAFLSFGCASIAPAEEKDQPTLPDIDYQIAALKDSFTGLYWKLWTQRKLSLRLYNCTARAVDQYEGVATAFADMDDYRKAQMEIYNSMSSDVNALLGELQEQFGAIFSLHVVTYYRDLCEELLENADNPEIRAKIEESGARILSGANPELRDEAERASRENRVTYGQVGDVATTGNKMFKQVTGIDPISSVTKMGVSAFEEITGANLGLGTDPASGIAKIVANTFKEITGVDLGLELGLKLGLEADSLSFTGIVKAGLNAFEEATGLGVTSFIADEATQLLSAMGVLSLFGVQSAAALVNPLITLYQVYNAFDIAVKLASGAENMRNSLYDPLHRFYLYSMPDELWKQIMDKPVRDGLQEFFAQVIRESVDAAERQN